MRLAVQEISNEREENLYFFLGGGDDDTRAGLRVLARVGDRPAGAGGVPEPWLRGPGVGDGGTSLPAAEGFGGEGSSPPAHRAGGAWRGQKGAVPR